MTMLDVANNRQETLQNIVCYNNNNNNCIIITLMFDVVFQLKDRVHGTRRQCCGNTCVSEASKGEELLRYAKSVFCVSMYTNAKIVDEQRSKM